MLNNILNVTINGKNYTSWNDVIKDYPNNNLDRSLLSQRYKRGKTDNDLIKAKNPQPKKRNPHNVIMRLDGRNFASLKDLSIFYNISYDTVKYRYRNGKRGKELVQK